MNKEQFPRELRHNVVDGDETGGLMVFKRQDVTRAFLAMGQTDDLWEHTGVPMETIREILVQAHNFIVIG